MVRHRLQSCQRSMVLLGVCVIVLLAPAGVAVAADDRPNFVSVYGAMNFEERIIDFLTEASATFQSSYLYTVAGTWSWGRTPRARWELEGQIVRHTGLQDHWELNVVPTVRWMDTPWDGVVDTRFAIGWGLSWASKEPPIEPRQEEEPSAGDSAQLLSYTLLEIEAQPPAARHWSGFLRIHHRSGVGGTFGGVEGGSNFLGLGVRYYFR